MYVREQSEGGGRQRTSEEGNENERERENE